MGELIRIGAEEGASGLGATIDTNGGYVTSFGFDGKDILHRRFENESGRYRGGMHPCAWWFGEASEPAHGPGRSELWTPTQSRIPVMNARPNRPEMGLILEWVSGSDTACEGLRHTLTYSILQRRSLRAELTIKNEDGPRVEMIAPGFHPYLDVDTETTEAQVLTIYRPTNPGEAVSLTRIDPESELRGEEPSFKEKLILGDNTTYIESNLMTTVTWSDDPSRYICFEPTQAGASLKLEDGAIPLKRGDERSFFINIATASIENRADRLA